MRFASVVATMAAAVPTNAVCTLGTAGECSADDLLAGVDSPSMFAKAVYLGAATMAIGLDAVGYAVIVWMKSHTTERPRPTSLSSATWTSTASTFANMAVTGIVEDDGLRAVF